MWKVTRTKSYLIQKQITCNLQRFCKSTKKVIGMHQKTNREKKNFNFIKLNTFLFCKGLEANLKTNFFFLEKNKKLE